MKEYIFNEVVLFVGEDGTIAKDGKTLKASSCSGYMRVYLQTPNGRKGLSVHRAVAITYHSNPLNKPDVNHIDGNKANNRVSNLEWITEKENVHHAIDVLGKQHRGAPRKLTKEQVIGIFEMKGKATQAETAKIYNTNQPAVSTIWAGKGYNEITKMPRFNYKR